MADYLLDCNHLSAALSKVSSLRDRIHQERRNGHRFVSCFPVLCELEAGIQQTAKPAAGFPKAESLRVDGLEKPFLSLSRTKWLQPRK